MSIHDGALAKCIDSNLKKLKGLKFFINFILRILFPKQIMTERGYQNCANSHSELSTGLLLLELMPGQFTKIRQFFSNLKLLPKIPELPLGKDNLFKNRFKVAVRHSCNIITDDFGRAEAFDIISLYHIKVD